MSPKMAIPIRINAIRTMPNRGIFMAPDAFLLNEIAFNFFSINKYRIKK
jgi:hypothetical protein